MQSGYSLRMFAGSWCLRAVKVMVATVYGGCCYHVLTNHIVTLATCEQQSMYPTINSTDVNDVILVDLITKKVARNDIVVLRQPDRPNDLICKRVTLLAGDRLPAAHYHKLRLSVVPRGHVWVEGDYKPVSYDSREFGPVPLGLVYGRVVMKIWPQITYFN